MFSGMSKILAMTLRIALENERVLDFQIEVPVNVFPMGELIIRSAHKTSQDHMYIQHVSFRAGTDGVVDVTGEITSHTFTDAHHFLEQHPDVSNLRIMLRA